MARAQIGRRMVEDVTAPQPGDVDLPFIFWRLHRIDRFSGHPMALTVAEHHKLCGVIADRDGHPPSVRRWARLHDAHEGVIGDIVRPVREVLGDEYLEVVASRWDVAIAGALGVDMPTADEWLLIRRVDEEAAAIEWIGCLGLGADDLGHGAADLVLARGRSWCRDMLSAALGAAAVADRWSDARRARMVDVMAACEFGARRDLPAEVAA